jgi:hypothetical protein
MTIQQHASFDSSAAELNATSKLVKAWESKNAKNAAKVGGISMMALSLAACGGSSTTTTTTTTPVVTPVTGQSFTLTNSTTADDFVGGAGDDTFNAATSGRLQDDDLLNGGDGTDTLNAVLNSATAHDGASIQNFEVLNFTLQGASTMNGATISGTPTVNVDGGFALTYGAEAGETFTLSGKSTGLTVVKSADATSGDVITIELTSGALGTVTIGNEGTMEYETINIVANGAASATLADAGTADLTDSDETLVITGSEDLALTIAAAALGQATTDAATKATINAADHTGELTLDLGVSVDATASYNDLSTVSGVDVVRVGTGGVSGATTANKLTQIKGLDGVETVHIDIFGDATDDVTLALKTATGSDDSLNILLDSKTNDTAIDGGDITVTGIENVTITSGGQESATATANVANVIDLASTATTASTLTIAGDRKLTVDSVDNQFTTVNVTNTAGSDLTIAAGGILDFNGGSAADRLELDLLTDLTSLDSLAGGEGKDTLAFSQVVGTDFSNAQIATFSGFEVLEYVGTHTISGAAATVDLTKLEGINELKLVGELTTNNTGTLTATVKGDSGMKVVMGGHTSTGGNAGFLALDVKNSANAGTNDTVTVALTDIGSADAHAGFAADNVENVTVEMAGGATAATYTLADIDGAQVTSLTIASTNTDLTATGAVAASDGLTLTTVESTMLTSVDASAMTGALNLNGISGKLSASGATLKGGSGADFLTGGSGADTITLGAGADEVIGGDGNDAIDGGAGADEIVGGAGNDTIDGGAGDDQIMGGAGTDTLTGGTGADVFMYTTSGVVTEGAGTNATNVPVTYTLTGDFVAGEVITIDDNTTNALVDATYTVQAGDTVTLIAAGLAAAYNTADSSSDATSSAGVLTVGGTVLAGISASVTTTGALTDSGVAVSGTTVSGADTIKDFDYINDSVLVAASTTATTAVAGASTNTTGTATSSVVVATGGKVTFAAADDTLAEKVTAIAADGTNLADGEVAFFEDSGNTYLYVANDTSNAATDALITLEDVTGLSTLDVSSGSITFIA